jgi:hypothetical protein
VLGNGQSRRQSLAQCGSAEGGGFLGRVDLPGHSPGSLCPRAAKKTRIGAVSARPASNAVILDRTLRRLRKADRLDDVAELLATLARTSARLVDTVCAPDSESAAYAQAACLRVHSGVLVELAARIGPVAEDGEDPWAAIARELDPATHLDRNDPNWDQVQTELAQDRFGRWGHQGAVRD